MEIITARRGLARRSQSFFSRLAAPTRGEFYCLLLCLVTVDQAQAAGVAQRGTLLTREGSVVYVRPPAAATNAPVGQNFDYGDRLRTLELSRASVRLSDATEWRMKELTTLEFLPPAQDQEKPLVNLLRGALYFFSRDKPREVQIQTPHVTGGLKGTEFLVSVEEARTVVVMFDGSVELSNPLGVITIAKGEAGIVEAGQAPRRAAIAAVNIVQWWLFYPGVLDPAALALAPADVTALAASLEAYRQGDLLVALQSYPAGRVPQSDAERCYYAGLLLAVGEVGAAEQLLAQVTPPIPLATALRTVIDAVTLVERLPPDPKTASEWLAFSYHLQARFDLDGARSAAREAVLLSKDFGFAWERLAELEFSFGRVPAATEALETSLRLAPRNPQAHALRGFLLSARNRTREAIESFEQALAIDGGLGNAWLGRGLCRIRQGALEAGRAELQTAAVLEPNRALLRSYLGKAYSDAGLETLARQELGLAKELDGKEPTPWLYSALLNRQQNRMNEAVSDLEKSLDLNDNRRLYRSRLLLDQDRAVRSANLATIYRDAGMTDWSVREAGKAVSADYANWSAHLFLANSYNELRDPRSVNLRYETPAVSEYLISSLLAPAGSGTLAPTISQQEYSKLFERDRLTGYFESEYLSRGAWALAGALQGTARNLAYGLEASYLDDPGERENQWARRTDLSARVRLHLRPEDSIYFQVSRGELNGGDLASYYDAVNGPNPTLRVRDETEPLVVAGYHHEWGPGSHTLFLFSHLESDFSVRDPGGNRGVLSLQTNAAGQILGVGTIFFEQNYLGLLEIQSGELQHILQTPRHATVVGALFQDGEFTTRNELANPDVLGFLFPPSSLSQSTVEDYQRAKGYLYHQWELCDELMLSGGVAYDWIRYPVNHRSAPITPGEESTERFLPKAGLIWTPSRGTTIRAAQSWSLGGTSFDQSFQLEPTQVAGFNQAFRSLIPESIAGANAGAHFSISSASWEQRLGTRTYLSVGAERLASMVDRRIGAYTLSDMDTADRYKATDTPERLDFVEQSVSARVHRLLGEGLAFSAGYRFSHAELDDDFEDIPSNALLTDPSFRVESELVGLLHEAQFSLNFNHPSGFFGLAEALWRHQSPQEDLGSLPDEDFWQVNLLAGWRFAQRRIELALGLLNVTDQDYRLHPINFLVEPPRSRTFAARVRFEF